MRKNANNVVWVEYWINQVNPSFEGYDIDAEQLENGKRHCEIKLPLIEKTVTSIADTEIEVILDASEKASKLINKYMKEHEDLVIENPYIDEDWIIESNKNGEVTIIGMSDEYREEQNNILDSLTYELIMNSRESIRKLPKKNREKLGIIVKIVNKSFFGNNLSRDELLIRAGQSIKNDHEIKDSTVCYDDASESIIIVGYASKKN